MTVHSGTEGSMAIGSNTVAIKSWTVNESANPLDSSSAGDIWKEHISGMRSWTANLDAHWDEAEAGQISVVTGTVVELKLYPEGSTQGDIAYTGMAMVTESSVSLERDSLTTFTGSFMGSGALTRAAVA